MWTVGKTGLEPVPLSPRKRWIPMMLTKPKPAGLQIASVLMSASLLAVMTLGPAPALAEPALPAASAATQVNLIGPAGSGRFGAQVLALPNGNIVVTDPNYSTASAANVGAVYLYNGRTQALISRLIGSVANDQVSDRFGIGGVTALTNGNYVVDSPLWNNGVITQTGAVTWCSGTAGCTGVVTVTNSLVGTYTGDQVGSNGVTALPNGNYVVNSFGWNSGRGAATWANGATGRSGLVSAANSLVGSQAGDQVGFTTYALTNNNYVVSSPFWANGAAAQAGAATWGNGAAGITGVVTLTNSLVGSHHLDQVSYFSVIALTNGNYVVGSPHWQNGAAAEAGAATWGNGATGITGVVTLTNSLVGSQTGDQVGFVGSENNYAGLKALTNGNYVVDSPYWSNGAVSEAGAATWGNGATGIAGVVTLTNSLVGNLAGARVSAGGTTVLANGNYVVRTNHLPAATWGNGATGITGVVTTTNSLVATSGPDTGGATNLHITALTNGNYVVVTEYGTGAQPLASSAVATWGNGTVGITGAVTVTNSLVSHEPGPQRAGFASITALTNGNYVMDSPYWLNDSIIQAGAVTWGNGTTGITGVVSVTNSLVGSQTGDEVGIAGVTGLKNGDYGVASSAWANGGAAAAGAFTWADSTTGITGVVTAANSLVGSLAGDQVSNANTRALANGNFVVLSATWHNGGLNTAGAVTPGDDLAGLTGPISIANSVLGGVAGGGVSLTYDYDTSNDQLVVGRPAENRVTLFPAPGIGIFGSGRRIPPGATTALATDGTDFGSVPLGSAITHTFTISNSSLGTLVLTGSPRVTLAGPAAPDFSVVVSPTTPIAGNASTDFQVRFSPTVTQARGVMVTIHSNDGDASPYVFFLQGSGFRNDLFLPLLLR